MAIENMFKIKEKIYIHYNEKIIYFTRGKNGSTALELVIFSYSNVKIIKSFLWKNLFYRRL